MPPRLPLPSLLRSRSIHSHRAFSTSLPSLTSPSPVELSYDHHPTPNPTTSKGPLIILHGLYGSKQNWRSLGKTLAKQLEREVFTLDLRNHGESPATPGAVEYLDYAADVGSFITSRSLSDVLLMGHSMGGKVAQSLALLPHKGISKLISVDMAPAVGPISPLFVDYLEAMKKVQRMEITSQRQADQVLAEIEPSLPTRQFLLTNLKPVPNSPTPKYRFRLPLDVLTEQLVATNAIGDFPFPPGSRSWDGPVLFVKGARSKYINRRSMEPASGYFPNHRTEILDADHWVHAERPKEFVELVKKFSEE